MHFIFKSQWKHLGVDNVSSLFLSKLPYTIWQCNNHFRGECLLLYIFCAWSIQRLFPCRQFFQYSHLVLPCPMKSKPRVLEVSIYRLWQSRGAVQAPSTADGKILASCKKKQTVTNSHSALLLKSGFHIKWQSFHFIHKRWGSSHSNTSCAEHSLVSSSQLRGTD